MFSLIAACAIAAPTGPSLAIAGPWQVRVPAGVYRVGNRSVRVKHDAVLDVVLAEVVVVKGEKYDSLPLFDPKAAPWTAGTRLRGLDTFETTAADLLQPDTVVVRAAPDGPALARGADYQIEPRWATVGRVDGGKLGADRPVWVDYRYGSSRLDSVVVDRNGSASLLRGSPHVATPMPPVLPAGATRIANIWVPGTTSELSADSLYPIVEPMYPKPISMGSPPAAALLPKTWAKLNAGQTVHVLAWGDSVTAGGQASDEAHRYQDRFAAMLRRRFPKATVDLTTVGWGGRNTEAFLKEPPGSPFNFEEKVLAPRPDLIVMEFVNDAYLTPAQVEERYSALLERFRRNGSELIILTPHFVRPDWMGAASVRVERDPRPYVAGLRDFAARHHVALADASLRWGHLLKEGIPYTTLLSNSINHPDDRGHELFASALIELFGGEAKR